MKLWNTGCAVGVSHLAAPQCTAQKPGQRDWVKATHTLLRPVSIVLHLVNIVRVWGIDFPETLKKVALLLFAYPPRCLTTLRLMSDLASPRRRLPQQVQRYPSRVD